MPLEFHNNAICLSGRLGTKLKSNIIHNYYNLWWQITSGGRQVNYRFPTSIIEMNAATGEIYIEDTDEVILGSAGCALDLKFNNKFIDNPDISIILVENNDECIKRLKSFIKSSYPYVKINEDVDSNEYFSEGCVLIRKDVNDAIKTINNLKISGRAIYFFDPLLSVNMDPLRKVYEHQVQTPFVIGTEFIIFFFTSDWIYGRDDFKPLPSNLNFNEFSIEELESIELLNNTFGDREWYNIILTKEDPNVRMKKLITEYQKRLFSLFRFVIPMPFAPKKDQKYHLIFCSNYREGANIISRFYKKLTNNIWRPNNDLIYKRFRKLHYKDIIFPGGNRRPVEWKLLWNFIRHYNHGKFDFLSRDVKKIEYNFKILAKSFEWLKSQDYIREFSDSIYMGKAVKRYELNWKTINKRLLMKKPPLFKPLIDNNFN